MIGLLFLILFDRDPADYLPCDPGRAIRYETSTSSTTDEVLGFVHPTEPRLCVIARGRARYARELLPDRVAFAGELDAILAFRPVLLKRPVYTGARWHYNRTDYRIVGVGKRVVVPAGTFDDTVWVEESGGEGAHSALSVYARGVGLVYFERGGAATVAASVR